MRLGYVSSPLLSNAKIPVDFRSQITTAMLKLFPNRKPDETCVKICGIRTAIQAEQIVGLGAHAVGLNFWPKSKRYLEPASAAEWSPDLKDATVRIGVFVNPSDDEIDQIFQLDVIDFFQMHGDESPEQVAVLRERGIPAFKAMGIKDRDMLGQLPNFASGPVLLDAYAPTEYGGTGETMDWALGREAVEQFPKNEVILAGGLVPENVAAAVRQVRPAAVDVASGVESEPGVKCLDKVKAFIDGAVKGRL
ncbi:MAG: phosphoribosylanthranilate isomerase [Verrucomicrobiota bacterium]